jgi:hypothetical protein
MTNSTRKPPSIVIVAAVLLTSAGWSMAAAQAQDAVRSLADNDSIFIDGKKFEILPGKARGDVAAQIKSLGARELGPGTVIFRSGNKLYIGSAPAGLAASTAAPPDVKAAAKDQPVGSLKIEYVPPKDPKHQQVYDLIKERHTLETLQKIFGVFRLTHDLTVKTVGCDGVSNAWYQRIGKEPTVSLCYEYLQEIWQAMPKTTTPAGITPQDALVGQLFFAIAHEMGHAMYDIFDVPIFGRQEDAADEFAAYIMLQFGGDRAHRLVTGAAYSYKAYIKDYKQKPQVTLPLAAFSSDHGAPEERFYNLLCMAYGYDAKVFADVVDNEYLPKTRAKKCRFEYEDLQWSFQQVFGPHIDKEKAKEVLATTWLADASTRPAPK